MWGQIERIESKSLRLSLSLLALQGAVLALPGHAAVAPETLTEAAPEVIWTLAEEPDLLAQATALATPVALYEWARNETEFVPYHGARSSSLNAFLGRRGNDVDLASMLIALFRSQGIPARYAQGLIRIPAAAALNWLGVQDLDLAAAILDDQGIHTGVKPHTRGPCLPSFFDSHCQKMPAQTPADVLG